MSKQTIATSIFILLVTNYLSLQAGQTVLYYKANAPQRRQAPAEIRRYGVNQVLSFEVTRLDFGRITGREPVSRRINFRNPGHEPVRVSRVKASCECTAVSLRPEDIAPGATGELSITVDPARSSPELAVSISVEYEGKTQIDRLLVSGQVLKANL